MFKREEHGGRLLGYGLQHKNVYFFFGSRHLSRAEIQGAFPEYELAFLKQVHGRAVVAADPGGDAEADAHFTRRVTRAPAVQTADCVPILIASRSQVCAIHSGWRGTAQNIVAAAQACFAGDKVIAAAIGPHILAPSFEVGQDVAAQLLAAAPEPREAARYFRPHADPAKTFFDMTQLVRDQIRASFGEVKIFECLHDTMTSPEFHSFRRDKGQPGRQFSFVVLNG